MVTKMEYGKYIDYILEQTKAVLDIDSPIPNRFAQEDKEGLEAFATALIAVLEQL